MLIAITAQNQSVINGETGMNTTLKGNPSLKAIAHWTSMYEDDAPALALRVIAWLNGDASFEYTCLPGMDLVLFVFCLKGKAQIELGDRKLILAKNQALILNTHDGYHAASLSEDFRFIFLQMQGSFAGRLLDHQLKDRGHICPFDPESVSLCDQIYRLAIQGWNYEREIRISCLLYDLCGQIMIAQARDDVLSPAAAFIENHYNDETSTEELAALCFLGPSQFIKRFNQAYGCPPGRYLNNVRITKAREMLLTTDLPVSAVALRVGFEDASYFTRIFKKATGQTPRQYRTSAPEPPANMKIGESDGTSGSV